MQLSDFQVALVDNIRQACSPDAKFQHLVLPLHDSYSQWLQTTQDSTGFKVTCDIQKWWRNVRINTTAVFTCRMLASAGREDMIHQYLSHFACETLFVFPEAQAFLEYIRVEPSIPLEIKLVAEFEQALLAARSGIETTADAVAEITKPEKPNRWHLGPGSTIAYFPSRIPGVEPTDEASDDFRPVIISPHIEHCWRFLGAQEYTVLTELLEAPEHLPSDSDQIVQTLINEKVLLQGPFRETLLL